MDFTYFFFQICIGNFFKNEVLIEKVYFGGSCTNFAATGTGTRGPIFGVRTKTRGMKCYIFHFNLLLGSKNEGKNSLVRWLFFSVFYFLHFRLRFLVNMR